MLDGISVLELLQTAARSVAAGTDAADMPRFVGSTLCASLLPPEFFMNDGDVGGSGKAAPAQLFTRIVLDVISRYVFRHACSSRLIANDSYTLDHCNYS